MPVIDVSPPNITCPSDIHVSTDVDESYASVKWDPPIATDNSGEEPLVTSRSVLTFPVKFPIGETIITYIAEDKAQNVAKCNFTVHVTGTVSNMPLKVKDKIKRYFSDICFTY